MHLRMTGVSLARESQCKSKLVDPRFPPPKKILCEYIPGTKTQQLKGRYTNHMDPVGIVSPGRDPVNCKHHEHPVSLIVLVQKLPMLLLMVQKSCTTWDVKKPCKIMG